MANRWQRISSRLLAPLARRFLFSDPAPRPIDQVILEMNQLSGSTVNRATALQVPAIVRARNQLAAIAALPILQLNKTNEPQTNPLFSQLDADTTNIVVLAQTFEDLFFDAIAWWEITKWDPQGYPVKVRRHDPHTVSLVPPNDVRWLAPLPSGVDPHGASVWIDGREVPASRVIRFDSPNPGLLTGKGAKAIRRWLILDAAASMYASEPRPLDYFSPADNAEEIDDDEAKKIIAEWRAARRKRATAWVPRALKYNTVDSPSPQQLQLVELQKQCVIDLANLTSMDPEDLGVSTTSRTYANDVDRRRNKINDVFAPYMRAVTDRLSMGDVTRGGHRVILDLKEYLRSNPTEQAAVHAQYKAMEAITVDEIREDLGRPPMPEPPARPALDPVAEAERIAREAAQQGQMDPAQPMQGEPMNNSARTALHFNTALFAAPTPGGVTRLAFDAIGVNFSVEQSSRTVWGMAIPYNQIVEKYGMRFRFMPGSIEWETPVSRAKFLVDHVTPIGYALSLTQRPDGVQGKWKLGRSPAADDALRDAEDGVYDGLSAGVEFDLEQDALWNNNDGVWDVYRAQMPETSITAMPAFSDARVTRVAASHTGGNAMEECAACGQRHAPGVACASRPQQTPPAPAPAATPPAAPGLQLSDDQLRAIVANPAALQALVGVAAPAAGTPATPGFTLSQDQISALAAGGHLRALIGINPAPAAEPEPARPTVNPGRPVATALVNEEAPYRFDRKGNLRQGKFDFSTDIIAGLGKDGHNGDHEALARAETFIRNYFTQLETLRSSASPLAAQFVAQSDVATLNPNQQRPDLYVDQKDFEYPIWGAINKGTIDNATPFVLPKFSSSSGLVAAHVENTEPTPGTFVATSQTITPSAVSGKVEISREAWDQGGNPQMSTLIWNQMVRGWYEALEASAVTLLEGLAPTTLTITTAAADSALEASITSQLAPLQYVRGGFRMRDFFVQVDLYKALVAAKDTSGRKLFPVLGAQNATGTAAEFFASLLVAGLVARPAWALAATSANSANSYLFDRADVSGWATTPQRLTFENISVAKVHLGIWGYKALANTDLTGIRRLAYDPV